MKYEICCESLTKILIFFKILKKPKVKEKFSEIESKNETQKQSNKIENKNTKFYSTELRMKIEEESNELNKLIEKIDKVKKVDKIEKIEKIEKIINKSKEKSKEKTIKPKLERLYCTHCGYLFPKPDLPVNYIITCEKCHRPLELPDKYYLKNT